MADYSPIHFYDELIEAIFDSPPAHEKSPSCPNGFVWNGKTYRVTEALSEWKDFGRRGRMARNMRPAHASARGSLNVGRFYFRVHAALSDSSTVRQTELRIFDIYYDRALKNVDERKGQWFIYRELIPS